MNTNQQKSVKRKICLFLTSGQFLLSCAKKKKASKYVDTVTTICFNIQVEDVRLTYKWI